MSGSKSDKKECTCSHHDALVVSHKHAAWSVAGLLLVLFFTFIVGYFLGQRRAAESFSQKIDQDSFADQIYYSLCSMYDAKDDPDRGSGEDTGDAEEKNLPENSAEQAATQEEVEKVVPRPVKKDVEEKQQSNKQYYAELVGFGSAKAAQEFMYRLHEKGMLVEVKKRQSKTAKGKTVFWYQVVTQKYASLEELNALVDVIKKLERIKDVRVVTHA